MVINLSLFSREKEMLDDIQWLKNSFEPWIMVLQKWDQTHQGRILYYSGSNIQEIIDTFVPFKNKLGWNLVISVIHYYLHYLDLYI